MPSGHIIHAEMDGFHVLRYFGRVSYTSAPGIKRFVDHIISQGKVSGLIFDLTEAEHLDSTNFGLMARVAERLRSSGGPRSVIVSTKEDIDCVLRSMGFDQIFDIVRDVPKESAISEEEVHTETPSPEQLRQTMVEAHRTLMRLSDAGRVQFRDVVACLEAEPAARRSGHPMSG
jgi:anti-anti-sigma factor